MTQLNDLITIVVISARDLHSLPLGISFALERGIRVIIARPSSLPRIDHLEHPNLDVVYGEQSFFQRIFLGLSTASTPYIFLSADDDFILFDNLNSALNIMMRDQSISIAAQTLFCKRNADLTISFSECYNHFNYLSDHAGLSPHALAYNLFNPLSVDFYTLYDRVKLLYLLNQLTLEPYLNKLWCLDKGMKAIQFFLAAFVALSGNIASFPNTLYIRDQTSKPLRFPIKGSYSMPPTLSLFDDYNQIRSTTDNYRLVSHWSSKFFTQHNYDAKSFDEFYLRMEYYTMKSIKFHTYTLGLSRYVCNIGLNSHHSSDVTYDKQSQSLSLYYQLGQPLPEYHMAMSRIYPSYFMASSHNRAALKSFSQYLLSRNL